MNRLRTEQPPDQTGLELSIVPRALAEDPNFVASVTQLINHAYASSEEGLWLTGAERTTPAEVQALIMADQLAAAWQGQALAGVVRVQRLDERTGELGMLAAAPELLGLGVGRALVHFAERFCREQGCFVMQLELLKPQSWSHPSKDRLDAWYRRIGYRVVRIGRLEEACPDLEPLLATPCDFAIYHKPLSDL